MRNTNMSTVVKDNIESKRYEIFVDGHLAGYADYSLSRGQITYIHTEVFPEFTGKGVARQLAREILVEAGSRDLQVLPRCPFIAKFIAKNLGAFLDLVPIEKRIEFDLPIAAR